MARHFVRSEVLAARPAPRRPFDPIGWLSTNLFSSPLNIAATVLSVALIAKLLPLTYVAAVVLMAMGALLIYADIVKPVNLFG